MRAHFLTVFSAAALAAGSTALAADKGRGYTAGHYAAEIRAHAFGFIKKIERAPEIRASGGSYVPAKRSAGDITFESVGPKLGASATITFDSCVPVVEPAFEGTTCSTGWMLCASAQDRYMACRVQPEQMRFPAASAAPRDEAVPTVSFQERPRRSQNLQLTPQPAPSPNPSPDPKTP